MFDSKAQFTTIPLYLDIRSWCVYIWIACWQQEYEKQQKSYPNYGLIVKMHWSLTWEWHSYKSGSTWLTLNNPGDPHWDRVWKVQEKPADFNIRIWGLHRKLEQSGTCNGYIVRKLRVCIHSKCPEDWLSVTGISNETWQEKGITGQQSTENLNPWENCGWCQTTAAVEPVRFLEMPK
jgi:hypothetical protein